MGRSEMWHISANDSDTERKPLLVSTSVGIEKKNETKGTFSCSLPDWASAAFILANIIVGMGLLNFPAAYRAAGGIPAALLAQAACLVFVIGGMLFMASAQEACGKENYSDIVEDYCGPWALLVCNLCILVHELGTCVTLLVIVGDQFDQGVLYWYGPDYCSHWFLKRRFTLPLCSVLLILPICFTKRVGDFRFVSILGVLTTTYLIWLAIWKYHKGPVEHVDISEFAPNWTDVFKALPTICYSFEGHIEATVLYAGFEGKSKSLRNFAKAVSFSMAICITTYTLFGVFGYLTYGDETTNDIMAAYRPLDALVITATIMVAIKAVTTFPVIFFCGRLVCDQLLRGRGCVEPKWTEPRRRVLLTIGLFSSCLATAILVPNIGSTISLLGGSGVLLIFVFPGLCYMVSNLRSDSTRVKLEAYAGAGLVVIGAFLGGTMTVQSIYGYLDGGNARREISCI